MAFVGKDNISHLIVLLHFEFFEDSHDTQTGRFRPLLMAGDHQSSKWDLFPITIFIRLFCSQSPSSVNRLRHRVWRRFRRWSLMGVWDAVFEKLKSAILVIGSVVFFTLFIDLLIGIVCGMLVYVICKKLIGIK